MRAHRIGLYLGLTAAALIWLTPVVFIGFTALKTSGELVLNPWFAVPVAPRWENFVDAWTLGKMGLYMRNTLLVCLVRLPGSILLSALIAFGLARTRMPGANVLFVVFVVAMMIPVQATLTPNQLLLLSWGLYNTLPGLGILHIAFGIPFGVLVLRGFMRTIPRDLDDAASIDGCGPLGVFARVVLPLSMPAISALIILEFLAGWNDLLLAQVYIRDDVWRPVTVGLLSFKGEVISNYPLLNAGILLSVIPILLVFLAFQRYFVSGVAGAVRG